MTRRCDENTAFLDCPDSHNRRKYLFLLLIVLGIALAVRLFSWKFSPVISRDSVLYSEYLDIWYCCGSYANTLALGFPAWIPPFALWQMKIPMYFGYSGETSGILVNLLLGTLFPLTGFLLIEEVVRDRRIAFWSAFFMAIHPVLVELSIEPQRDMIYLFWAILALFFLCRGINRSSRGDWGLSGIFTAAAFLTRYESMEIILLPFVYFTGSVLLKKDSVRYAVQSLFLFYGMALFVWLGVSLCFLPLSGVFSSVQEFVVTHGTLFTSDGGK